MLAGQTGGWRLGWGVLAGRGMAAWINAHQQVPEIREIPVAPQQDTQRPAPQQDTPAGQTGELVHVLAGMALTCLRAPQPHHSRA